MDLGPLHRLARDIQRQILAVDHPLDEAEVRRQEILRLLLDQHFARVELDLPLDPPLQQAALAGRGDVEEGVQIDRCVGRDVQVEERLAVVEGQLLVELLVLLVGDLMRLLPPEGRLLIRLLVIDVDREGDEVGVALDRLLDPPGGGELGGVLAQPEGDRRAALGALRRADRERLVAAAAPLRRLGVRAVGEGGDDHLFGDDERGVKPDAELADQLALLARLQPLHERLDAGLGDRAQMFGQLVGGHPDPAVGDRDRLRLLVGRDPDRQLRRLVARFAIGQQLELDPVEGIGGVGEEFAQEDLAVGVERVRQDRQQLFHFGAERHLGLVGDGRLGRFGGHRKSPLSDFARSMGRRHERRQPVSTPSS